MCGWSKAKNIKRTKDAVKNMQRAVMCVCVRAPKTYVVESALRYVCEPKPSRGGRGGSAQMLGQKSGGGKK